ncbi:lipid kinase, YegS/Rv2252/BmrU family [Tangfeifania diversioriginum]|uniref:Lipid kinase, YegS/Rv2252/BmrU family n=1 Tax=Tangfeifania diversioriginum TaxID=1168035 RepID=A0A1M6L3X3_9BACT|nr:diacylglycerol kinase family protein [Tangfeifania diversioriginum]SHJ65892.1 lipid kinase, YegS/Rv2252/BmrU family [Tangfeifania diversioriginum]
MVQKITFIINPVAGPHDNLKYMGVLKKSLKKSNIPFRTKVTKHKNHAAQLAQNQIKQEGNAVIVSIGGDGTFNEVASELVNSKASLGHIPRGSGNGLARMLNITGALKKVRTYLANPTIQKIDAGKIGEKYFFCTSGFGFDALIARYFEKSNKRGLKSYVFFIIKNFFRFKGVEADFELDGERFSGRFFTVTIANANQYGNNAFIAPKAEINDGYLDVTLIRPFPRWYTPLITLALFGKWLDKLPYVDTRKVKHIKINHVASTCFHRDGDADELSFPTNISVIPDAIQLLVPKQK